MGFGGPVWHASAASTGALHWPSFAGLGPEFLERKAREALEGVGEASLGEWAEWTGVAFHVRRRLSAAEEALVGPVMDVRGTEEARRRMKAAWLDLPEAARRIAREEIRPAEEDEEPPRQ
jgi:hypothetical protein